MRQGLDSLMPEKGDKDGRSMCIRCKNGVGVVKRRSVGEKEEYYIKLYALGCNHN